MSDPSPISGVEMSTAAFLGEATQGPGEPTPIASWAEFAAIYGDFVDQAAFDRPTGFLHYAVRGYFENGGQSAVIARVPDLSAGILEQTLAAVCDDQRASLIALPDHVNEPSSTAALVTRCDAAGWPLAILATSSPVENVSTLQPPHDTKNAALYYPWLRVPAPHRPDGTRIVPAVGHIAGIIARVAHERGVHLAPANEPIVGLAADPLSVLVSRADQDVLNPRGVNVIRDFRSAGRGIRVWGARTTSSDPEWKYVNVRRLLTYLERSIAEGTRWAVFEPNTPPTWTSMRACIEEFLARAWRDGALQGRKVEEAFFVRCDRTTMTQDDLDRGRLVCLIGVAPVRPAEFVIFRIGQWTGSRSA